MIRYAAWAAFGALCFVATSPTSAQRSQSPPEPPESPLDDIVVTARKRPARDRPDAIGYYRRYCFDAVRHTGRFAPPEDDVDWDILTEPVRRKFGITDAAVPAFGTVDAVRGITLVIKFERAVVTGKVTELRCTLAAIGGDHRGFVNGLSAMFRGPPTRRHVGQPDGYAKVAGWQQWLWSENPARGSKSWRSINGGRKAADPTWLVVTDLDFYQEHDYIIGDLKTRQGTGSPISTLTFAYLTTRSLP